MILAFVSKDFKKARYEELALSTTAYSETGWVFQSFFVNANGAADLACSSVTSIIGYRVNHCVKMSTYSVMFQLTRGHTCSRGVIQYFSDAQCRIFVGTSSLEISANRCLPAQSPLYANMNAQQMMKCTTYAQPIPPAFPELGITTELFLNQECKGNPAEYRSVASDKCIDMGGFYAKYDCTGDTPGYYTYATNTCSGQRLGYQRLSSGCLFADDVTDDDYNPTFLIPPVPSISSTYFPTSQSKDSISPYTENVFCTANAPTLYPNAAPTVFPTLSTAKSVQFKVEQKVYGIDMETFIRNDKNQQSFITTVINTMSGVVANNVRDFYVVDTQQRRRLGSEVNTIENETEVLLDITQSTGKIEVEKAISSPASSIDSIQGPATTRSLSLKLVSLVASVRSGLRLLNNPLVVNSAVLVTYTINCTTIYSSEQLFGQLYTSVSTGAFSEDLYTNANAIGATDMVGVTSLSVNYPCSIDCGNKDANWFWWYTALIAAGGFLALMIAVFVGQWCYEYYGKSEFGEVDDEEKDHIGIPDDDRILEF
eukprot:gene16224-18517_t